VLETAAELGLAIGVGTFAALHAAFPPSLSEPTAGPLLGFVGAGVALGGAVAKGIALRRIAASREPPR
jgi:hypothetical protein